MRDDDLIAFTRKALALLFIVALAALVVELSYLLILVFASVVVAVVLRSLAGHFLRLRLGDGAAVGLAVLSLLAIFAGLGWMFGGLVSGQFVELGRQLPQAVDAAQAYLDHWHIDYNLSEMAKVAREQLSSIFQRASGFVISVGGVVADVAVVFVGGIFFAADPAFYRGGVLRLLPRSVESLMADALDDCGRGLQLWLKGQMASSLFIAVLTLVGLLLLQVPSAYALAILAGAFDFIPYLGPVLAAIPGVLVGFSASPSTGLWTIGLFVLVQQIQGHVVQPMVQKSSVDLPPVVLLFTVIATGTLFGPPGVLLAAPMTIVGYILVQHLYIGAMLGRSPKRPAGPRENT
ncbi:AI-2E family transporter [Novosphingobium sp. SG707]|uniref:AI-2E family transporter n=1 Tax=Novosphingobium sp. SG707 TaxID=2586996 RepID=UPI001444E4EE|nr:AI-2E family transporter [Novosphingobium sp. SG707]NKI99095.1 putative PurR-regulated permease PerM [Novosphingobium sp. SG707]